MTDDAGTHKAHGGAEGRTPSDFTDDRGAAPEFSRPEFLPAGEAPFHGEPPRDDGWSQLGGPPGYGQRNQQPGQHSGEQGYTEQLRYDDRGSLFGEGGQGDQTGQGAYPAEAGWGDPSGRARQETTIFTSPGVPPPPPSQAFGMGPGWAPPPGAGGPARLRGHRASRPSRAAHGHDGRSRPGDRTPGLDAGELRDLLPHPPGEFEPRSLLRSGKGAERLQRPGLPSRSRAWPRRSCPAWSP